MTNLHELDGQVLVVTVQAQVWLSILEDGYF